MSSPTSKIKVLTDVKFQDVIDAVKTLETH